MRVNPGSQVATLGETTPQTPGDKGVAERLRAAASLAGFTEDGLRERLEPKPEVGLVAMGAVRARRLGGDDPLSTLARLFWLGAPVGRGAASAALEPASVEELIGAGLLTAADNEIRPRFRITPHRGLLLASDLTDLAHQPHDVVGGRNPVALALDWMTIRSEVDSALDLGTGSGIQALLAARHAREIVGVDVNPRALEFAAFNASLNEVESVSWELGSWLEPVAERQFEHVLANPPYVISPEHELLYRDSGHPGDGLSRNLVETIPSALAEGGIAQMLCDWIIPDEGDWAAPVLDWVDGTGCEALVVRLATRDPLTYAAGWNEPLLADGTGAYEQALDRWLDYLSGLGVDQIAWGLIVLRKRPDRAERLHAVDGLGAPTAACGEHVRRLLDAEEDLRRLRDDSSLLAAPVRLADGHRIDQTLVSEGRRYRSHPARVRIVPGLQAEALIDPDALDVLFECDGTRPLGTVVDEVAGAANGDRDELARSVLEAVRELLRQGMLELG